jgi:hypothetical protein
MSCKVAAGNGSACFGLPCDLHFRSVVKLDREYAEGEPGQVAIGGEYEPSTVDRFLEHAISDRAGAVPEEFLDRARKFLVRWSSYSRRSSKRVVRKAPPIPIIPSATDAAGDDPTPLDAKTDPDSPTTAQSAPRLVQGHRTGAPSTCELITAETDHRFFVPQPFLQQEPLDESSHAKQASHLVVPGATETPGSTTVPAPQSPARDARNPNAALDR